MKFGATDMLVSDNDKGVELASTLGAGHVAMMRGHGAVACGRTLQMAVFRAAYTEVNARVQHWTAALAGGEPIAALTQEEGLLADVPNEPASLRAWNLWRTELRTQVDW